MSGGFKATRKDHVLQIWSSRFVSLDIIREESRVLFVHAVRWPFQLRLVAEVPWNLVGVIWEHLQGGPTVPTPPPAAPPQGVGNGGS